MCFSDAVRADVDAVLAELRVRGVQLYMTSGDSEGAARQAAETLGIAAWRARQTPLDKADLVQGLQRQGERVAFVGDGVNDAAALVQADLGISIGTGTDIAIEAGHMVLVHSDLSAVPVILQVARRAITILRQNIAWAIAYNMIAVVAAIAGYASPAAAAAAMALSSAFVLGNSLRVIGWSPVKYARGFCVLVGVLVGMVTLAWFSV